MIAPFLLKEGEVNPLILKCLSTAEEDFREVARVKVRSVDKYQFTTMLRLPRQHFWQIFVCFVTRLYPLYRSLM